MRTAFARRIQRIEAAVKPALQKFLLVHEAGSEQYLLDGASILRADLDRLLLAGHTAVIREIPFGYMG
jgi:hypothetical protein